MEHMNAEDMQLLITALRDGEIGLNDHRKKILNRVPEQGDWGLFRKQIEAMDLVWLAAATGNCFELYECSGLYQDSIIQILRHSDDIVYGFLKELLTEGKVHLTARCRPGEIEPETGADDGIQQRR